MSLHDSQPKQSVSKAQRAPITGREPVVNENDVQPSSAPVVGTAAQAGSLKGPLVAVLFIGGIWAVGALLARPASSLWLHLYFPYAERSETIGGGWAVEAYVLFMIFVLISSRTPSSKTRRANMMAVAVSVLLFAFWGVHAANGAFTHGRRWTALYRVSGSHYAHGSYFTLSSIDSTEDAPPLRVDADLLPSSTRVGDDVNVELAEGRFGHTWVVSYKALP